MRVVSPHDIAETIGLEGYSAEQGAMGESNDEKLTGLARRFPGSHNFHKSRASKGLGVPSKSHRLLYVEYMTGKYSPAELAVRHGFLDSIQVKKVVKGVHKWTERQSRKEQEDLKSEQDMELRRIADMALDAYVLSAHMRRVKKVTTGNSVNQKGEVNSLDKTETTYEKMTGDPRYLNVALGARQQIAELHGLKAPSKVAHTAADGGPMKLEVIHKQLETADEATLKKLRVANRALENLSKPAEEPIDTTFEVKPNADPPTDPGASTDDVPAGA